jgi:hypothetical protein
MSFSFVAASPLPRRSGALWVALWLGAQPLASHAAPACVQEVSMAFIEGAPRDRFEVRNESSKGQRIQQLTLDLTPSAGRLIFDTLEGGTGVDVFQPFRVEAGEARLGGSPVIQDGSQRLTLRFTRFEPGQRFVFSIDVDDQLSASDLGQTRVSGREMEGALLNASFGLASGTGSGLQARVDGNNRARATAACP